MGTCISLFMQEFSGCPSNDSRAMAECFRKLPVERFAASESEPCKQKLLATADGVYLPDDPEKLLRTGQYNKDIDVIMGTMSTEGYWLSATRIPPLVAEDTSLERVQGYFLHEVTRRYPRLPLYVRQAAVAAAVVAYVRDTRTNGLIKAATEFFGDSFLLWPTYATALDFSSTLIMVFSKYLCASFFCIQQRHWKAKHISTRSATVLRFRIIQISSAVTTAMILF